MRVCFLTHYFPPEVGAPQTRIELLARALAEAGEQVVVHTGFPHYPDGGIKAPYTNRPWLSEHRDAVSVVRSAVYPAPNRGFARRLLDHSAFAVSALAAAPLSGPLDVVVAETPPLFTAAAGALYAMRKRAAFVVHVADRWPASAVELGALRNRRAIAAAEALERWVYQRADLILSPTEGIAASLRDVPEAGEKSRRVWPVVDLDRFNASAPAQRGSDETPAQRDSDQTPAARGSDETPARNGPLRLLFAGTVGLAHGLDVLVEASRLAGPDVVQTTIAGGGADGDRIRGLIDQQGVSNVRMLGVLPADQIPALYRESDASVVLLKDLPIFEGALPTKMLEGMAAGRPLVLCARGEAARFVERAQSGVVVAPGDAPALARAIRRLHDDPWFRESLGAAGRRYVEAHFGAERAAQEWAAQLRTAIERRLARQRAEAGGSARVAADRDRAG